MYMMYIRCVVRIGLRAQFEVCALEPVARVGVYVVLVEYGLDEGVRGSLVVDFLTVVGAHLENKVISLKMILKHFSTK